MLIQPMLITARKFTGFKIIAKSCKITEKAANSQEKLIKHVILQAKVILWFISGAPRVAGDIRVKSGTIVCAHTYIVQRLKKPH